MVHEMLASSLVAGKFIEAPLVHSLPIKCWTIPTVSSMYSHRSIHLSSTSLALPSLTLRTLYTPSPTPADSRHARTSRPTSRPKAAPDMRDGTNTPAPDAWAACTHLVDLRSLHIPCGIIVTAWCDHLTGTLEHG